MTTEKQTMTMTELATALKHGKLELPGHLALEVPRMEQVPIGELAAAITDGVRRVLGPDDDSRGVANVDVRGGKWQGDARLVARS